MPSFPAEAIVRVFFFDACSDRGVTLFGQKTSTELTTTRPSIDVFVVIPVVFFDNIVVVG